MASIYSETKNWSDEIKERKSFLASRETHITAVIWRWHFVRCKCRKPKNHYSIGMFSFRSGGSWNSGPTQRCVDVCLIFVLIAVIPLATNVSRSTVDINCSCTPPPNCFHQKCPSVKKGKIDFLMRNWKMRWCERDASPDCLKQNKINEKHFRRDSINPNAVCNLLSLKKIKWVTIIRINGLPAPASLSLSPSAWTTISWLSLPGLAKNM